MEEAKSEVKEERKAEPKRQAEAKSEVNSKAFLADPANVEKLRIVAIEYGRTVRSDGGRIVHDIPEAELQGLIALCK